jgi:hypothetical protein
MPTYQLLRCMVALGGDKDNVVARHRGNPIAYPELAILQHMHGYDAVTEVFVLGTADMTTDEMLARLRTTYDDKYLKEVYPGTRPKLPTDDAALPHCTLPMYVPKPTRPDNPDPVLKPLTVTSHPGVQVIEHELPVEELPPEPELDEATIREFEEPEPEKIDLAQAMRPAVAGGMSLNRPTVEDQPQTRVGFRGQARQARRTEAHLPDVSGQRERRPEEHDHDQARG